MRRAAVPVSATDPQHADEQPTPAEERAGPSSPEVAEATREASSSSGYLADTSVFIAAEQRRPLGTPPPGEVRVSVATITELGVGVRRAHEAGLRTLREATLERARRFIALPYDETVADRLAELLASAREQQRRAGAMDAIIAATALANDLVIWTQDDDFEILAELAPSLRLKRG